MIDFFYSMSGMVQQIPKGQAIEVFPLSSLDAQSALGMRHFSFKVQNLPIFKVLNLRKENFNCLALLYLSCTIPGPKFVKELKKSVH